MSASEVQLDGRPTGDQSLSWSSFKVVQMVLVHCISRLKQLKIDFLAENLKKSSSLKPEGPGL